MSRDLHSKAYSEWKEEAADEYIQAQRRAFLDGFETAAEESQQFTLLREWLEEQRDKEKQRYEETGENIHNIRRLTLIEVLVKLSEMGNRPGDAHE